MSLTSEGRAGTEHIKKPFLKRMVCLYANGDPLKKKLIMAKRVGSAAGIVGAGIRLQWRSWPQLGACSSLD